MSVLRLIEHNQGDTAILPPSGWDVACVSEQSRKPAPNWAERHWKRSLKGLAICWDPDVLDVQHKGSALAHIGLAKFSPNRGTLWIEADLIGTPWRVAVVCSHRINDPDGSERQFGPVRRLLWSVHAGLDRRIITRLERRGFLVLYGGDINDRTATLEPLTRELTGHYDAIGYSTDKRLRLVSIVRGDKGGSDHNRFTATFNIGK